jgi:hypothetical protein
MAFNSQEHADKAEAILKANLAQRPPAELPGTPDIAAEKRARLAETEADNARVLTERRRYRST